MASFERKKYVKSAFQINKDEFGELNTLMSEFGKELNDNKSVFYNVQFTDDKIRKEMNLHEFLALSNSRESIIKQVDIYTKLFEKNKLMITFFASTKWYNMEPIAYHLETSNEPDFLTYEKKILDFFAGLKPTYSFFNTSIFWFYALLYVPFLLFTTSIVVKLDYFDTLVNSKYWLLVWITFYSFTVLILFSLRSRIFPIGEINIGAGLKRSQTLNWIRTSIIVSLVLWLISYFINF